MIMAYALVFLNVMSVYLCYIIARDRGADPRFWGWMGLFLGPIALPFVWFAKRKFEE
tara:strand:- start:292 stop:462 length:171 start_codon:yes stop_codon:yes gene_type:complete